MDLSNILTADNLSNILTAILTVGGAFGAKYVVKLKKTLKELDELFTVVNDSLSDDAVTGAEIKKITKEAKDIIAIWN